MSATSIVLSVIEENRRTFFTPEAIARLEALGTVSIDPDPAAHATEESKALLRAADVVITGWGTGSLDEFLTADGPRIVVHSGGSIHSIASESAFEHGVRLASQTQLNAEPVAEYTLAMIILAAKDIFAARRHYLETRRKDDDAEFWAPFPTIGIYGATIGIIGLSRISRLVIKHLQAFNCTIKVQSGHLTQEQADELGVVPASLEEIMSTSDVVSLHSASNARTFHMIKGEHFAMMKDGATFINTARGAIVDQDAMIEELKKDRIRAILDVTEPEVNEPDSPLWTLPNVFLTPHAAGSLGRELHRLGDGAVADVENLLAGRPAAGEITADTYSGRA